MLSQEWNEKLTRVGPGTPMGELLRRYWYPIAGSAELEENPVKKVRLLCEDLVLYRDRSGNLGLIDEPCPHRRVSMEYGIPEPEGLRCPYHGWVFNHEGRCLEQPAEPWDSTFKDRVTTKAYPVQELGGLVFAYLGPQPVPLLPRYDLYVWDDVVRQVGATMIPCNWLQCMENSLDPVHVEHLHGRYMDYVWSRKGVPPSSVLTRRHKKIGFDRFEHGIIKRRVVEGNTEEDDPWKIGHPVIFPYVLRQGGRGIYNFQIRVPVDDTHTWHLLYTAYRPRVPVPKQESVPLYEIPLYYEDGTHFNEAVVTQDFLCWATQGPIAKRDLEHLGQSDIGVIMFRELLREQLEVIARGEDPMEVYRDPAKNQLILLPQEDLNFDVSRTFQPLVVGGIQLQQSDDRFGPMKEQLTSLFMEARERAARGESLLPAAEPPVILPGETHRAMVIAQ